jgi:hypothetical protein
MLRRGVDRFSRYSFTAQRQLAVSIETCGAGPHQLHPVLSHGPFRYYTRSGLIDRLWSDKYQGNWRGPFSSMLVFTVTGGTFRRPTTSDLLTGKQITQTCFQVSILIRVRQNVKRKGRGPFASMLVYFPLNGNLLFRTEDVQFSLPTASTGLSLENKYAVPGVNRDLIRVRQCQGKGRGWVSRYSFIDRATATVASHRDVRLLTNHPQTLLLEQIANLFRCNLDPDSCSDKVSGRGDVTVLPR